MITSFSAVLSRFFPRKPRHAWDRWLPAWHGLFLMLVAFSAALALADPVLTGDVQWVLFAGSTAMLAWYFLPHLRAAPSTRLALVAYFGVGWVLWFALASAHPAYFLMLFILFPHVFIVAPMPWSVVLSMALNGLVLLQLQVSLREYATTPIILTALGSGGGVLLAYFITDIIRQSERRQMLIDQLEAARDSLAQAQRAAGVNQERQRLAGELHDTTIQSLIGVLMALEAAESAPQDAERLHLIAQAREAARDSLSEARRFIWNLRPTALEGRAFEDGLRYVVDQWAKSTAIPAWLVVTGTPGPLSDAVEITLLRVAQEALANILRHAHAGQVTVTLSYMPNLLALDINDDGVGFVPEHTPHGGFGLTNMRRRVGLVGGTLNVESAPGEGTTLTAQVPLYPAPQPDSQYTRLAAGFDPPQDVYARPDTPAHRR